MIEPHPYFIVAITCLSILLGVVTLLLLAILRAVNRAIDARIFEPADGGLVESIYRMGHAIEKAVDGSAIAGGLHKIAAELEQRRRGAGGPL